MKTACILVLYNPDWTLLYEVLDSVCAQVDALFISDNSEVDNSDKLKDYPQISYQANEQNLGIAEAQNQGVMFFENKGYDFVLFLDQDSILADNMLKVLHEQYENLRAHNIKVGGICARILNRESNEKEIGRIRKGKKITRAITQVSEIISSGSLIPIEHFKSVGYFDSELFIDGVDHEWCWRAKAKGDFQFFIIEKTLLSHQRGEGNKKVGLVTLTLFTPFRVFYQYRNYFSLSKRDYVPLYWKISNGIKLFLKYFYYVVLSSKRAQYFKQINKGIWEGLKK